MKFSNVPVLSILAASLATVGAVRPASGSDNAGDAHALIANATTANVSVSDPKAPSPTPAEKTQPRRIDAMLWRNGKSQQTDYSKYYSMSRYTGDRFQAIVDSVGRTIGVGGQTPAAPATDPKAQPPATPAAPAAPAAPASRALPSPIENPPFPFTDWTINSGFPIGESWDSSPGTLQHYLFGTKLDNTHWRIGGWADGGVEISNAKNSNLPDTYNLIPNHPELDQFVFVVQKMVDTVQKSHVRLGDSTRPGFMQDRLPVHALLPVISRPIEPHNLYGYDPVLNWAEIYLPKGCRWNGDSGWPLYFAHR